MSGLQNKKEDKVLHCTFCKNVFYMPEELYIAQIAEMRKKVMKCVHQEMLCDMGIELKSIKLARDEPNQNEDRVLRELVELLITMFEIVHHAQKETLKDKKKVLEENSRLREAVKKLAKKSKLVETPLKYDDQVD